MEPVFLTMFGIGSTSFPFLLIVKGSPPYRWLNSSFASERRKEEVTQLLEF